MDYARKSISFFHFQLFNFYFILYLMPSPGNKYFADSIFWIEVEKISPNPFQPRRDFDEAKLKDLAESIRMYGVLQPLVVTRREMPKDERLDCRIRAHFR